MPDAQYTFGPPGQAGSATITPEPPKKPTYTFGPQGGVAKPATPPPVAPPTVAQPKPVTPVATPPAPAPKPPTPARGVEPPAGPFASGVVQGMGFDPKKIEAAKQFKLGDKLYPKQHPMVQEGAEIVREATKGLTQWMEASAKDPLHLVDPIVSMGTLLDFHTGYPKLDKYLTGVGADETALDEIGSGIKSGDTTKLEHGAGLLVGGLSQIFAGLETPEVAEGLANLPSKAVETASVVNEARNKAVVTAAANNVLHNDLKMTIAPAVKQNLEAIRNGIARDAQAVVTKDKAASAVAGKSAFQAPDIATSFQDAVTAKSATKAPLPQTRAVLKSFVQTVKKHGPDLSWEDVKDLRSQVFEAMDKASLKDRAVLGQVYDKLGDNLAQRAKAVGASDEFTSYSDLTRKQREFREGIVNTLTSKDTGLKVYEELARQSNKPQLNDFFNTAAKHGGVPLSLVDDMVRTRKPIYELARRADQGESAGGRMGAILRHPLAAGTAMVGTGAGLSMVSPIPITGSFVASLVAAQKVANFMDRYDAVKAMRSIRKPPNLLQGLPTPGPSSSGATPSPGGPVTPPQGPPASPPAGPTSSPFVGGNPPLGPSPAGGGGVPRVSVPTPTTGAPPAPPALEELQARISNAMKRQQAASEPSPFASAAAPTKVAPIEVDVDKLSDAMIAKGKDRLFASQRAEELAKILKNPEKYTANEVKQAQNAKAMWEGPERRSSTETVDKEQRGVEPAAPKADAAPYEKFGVKIDKASLTTPEAVRAAKADGTNQIEELARARFKEIQKLSGDERTTALKALEKDVTQAKRSLDKMQTPDVSRAARDRVRKAEDPTAKPAERSVLENMNPDEVARRAARGVTEPEDAMMTMIDYGRRAEKLGGTVLEVFKKVQQAANGNDKLAATQLKPLFDRLDAIDAAKKSSGQ